MKIFHFSDNHGRIRWLKDAIPDDVDLIISTGDFFPNVSRGNRVKEVPFQTRWFDEQQELIFECLKGKPFMCVDGNHDYIPLGQAMILGGYTNTMPITPDGVMFDGLCFAGFPEVPYFTGEWNFETEWIDLREVVEDTLFSKPDVLVTHAPCLSVLDDGIGIEPLLTQLMYAENCSVKHHFFGHNHRHGGESCERMEIQFHNNATTGRVIEI